MEPRFGRDFGEVLIHTDASAARATRMLHADAFATGRDIYFAQGRYQPETHAGRRLLAHELTHTIQQGGRAGAVSRRPEVVGHPSDPLEHEADLAAERVGELLASHNPERLAGQGEGAGHGIRSSHSNGVVQRDADAGTPDAPQADVDRIISALQEPQENGVGNYPAVCAILDGMWIVVMFQTLEELRNRGYLDLLRGDVCPNMPRVRIAVDAVIAKSSPPVTWLFAKAHPAFADLPEQQKQEVATYLVLPWPMPVEASAVADQDGLTNGEIIAGVLIGAAVVGGALLLLTPGGQAIGLAVLIAIAPVGGETAVVAGAPVVVEIVTGSLVAETAAATTVVGGSAVATSTAVPVLVTTAVTAPTVAGTTVTTVAASSWATAAAATIGTGIAATTLSSDGPQKPNDDPQRPPFVLRLPPPKVPHLATYRAWLGVLQSDPNYLRGNPAQLDKWHQAHRIGGSDPIPESVYERGHALGLTGEEGEKRIRVPDWSRIPTSMEFQVDHIIELQVTPASHRDQFNSIFNYELLDSVSNGSSGPMMAASIAAERVKQVAYDPSAAGRVLLFDDIQPMEAPAGERWRLG